MKLMFSILLFFPVQCFSWSLIDKIQYDSYSSCVDHKIKDVDRTKTDMYAARRAFQDDCKKAFCSSILKVDDEEHNSCLEKLHQRCSWRSDVGTYDYFVHCVAASTCPEHKYKDKTCPGVPKKD